MALGRMHELRNARIFSLPINQVAPLKISVERPCEICAGRFFISGMWCVDCQFTGKDGHRYPTFTWNGFTFVDIGTGFEILPSASNR